MSTIKQMSKEEVNRELCERLGLCWHDEKWKPETRYYECSYCGKVSISPGMNSRNNDFFSDSGKVRLLREMRKSYYWNRFYIWASGYERIAFKRLIETKEFKIWHKIKAASVLQGISDIDREVDELMQPKYMKIETYTPT